MNMKKILITIIIGIIAISAVGTAYCTGMFPDTYSKFTHTEDFGNFTMEIPNDVTVTINKTANSSWVYYDSTTNDKFRVGCVREYKLLGLSTFDVLINHLNNNQSLKSINEHDFSNNCKIYEIVQGNCSHGKYCVVTLVDGEIIVIMADDLDVIKKCLETVKVKTTPVNDHVTESNNTTEVSETKLKNNTESDDYYEADNYNVDDDYYEDEYYDDEYYDDEGNGIIYGGENSWGYEDE